MKQIDGLVILKSDRPKHWRIVDLITRLQLAEYQGEVAETMARETCAKENWDIVEVVIEHKSGGSLWEQTL